jgi:hypothetical protein
MSGRKGVREGGREGGRDSISSLSDIDGGGVGMKMKMVVGRLLVYISIFILG